MPIPLILADCRTNKLVKEQTREGIEKTATPLVDCCIIFTTLWRQMNLNSNSICLIGGLIGIDFGFRNLSNASIDRLRIPKYSFPAPQYKLQPATKSIVVRCKGTKSDNGNKES